MTREEVDAVLNTIRGTGPQSHEEQVLEAEVRALREAQQINEATIDALTRALNERSRNYDVARQAHDDAEVRIVELRTTVEAQRVEFAAAHRTMILQAATIARVEALLDRDPDCGDCGGFMTTTISAALRGEP